MMRTRDVEQSRTSAAGTGLPLLSRKKIAVFIVVLLLVSSVLIAFPRNGMVEGATAHTITYHSGFVASGESSEKTVDVTYYGIAATEYNPEYWSESLSKLLGQGDLDNGIAENWEGPAVDGTVNLTISKFLAIQEYEVWYVSNSDWVCYMRAADGSETEHRDPTGDLNTWTYGYDVGIDSTAGDVVFKIVLDQETLSGAKIKGILAEGSNLRPVSEKYGIWEDRFHINSTNRYKISYFVGGSGSYATGTYNRPLSATELYYALYNEDAEHQNKEKFVRFGIEFELDLATPQTLNLTDSNFKKVFAGWSKLNPDDYLVDESNYTEFAQTSNFVYPGDVVSDDVRDLYAIWLYPDIELGAVKLNSTTVYDASKKQLVTTLALDTSTLQSSIQPYIDINSLKIGKQADEAYHFDSEENGVLHYEPGVTPNSDKSMFVTIYKLKNSNGYVSVTSATEIPSGTYRSYSVAEPISIRIQASIKAGGNVIIDNVKFDQASYSADNRLGNIDSFTINANYNRLILGTNISIDEDRLKTYGEGSNYINLLRAPYVLGGSGNSSKILESGKDIVSASDSAGGTCLGSELKVNISTYVIVHSGIYCHLSAGPTASSKVTNSSVQLSTYMVVKDVTAMGIVSGSAGNSEINTQGSEGEGFLQGGSFVYCCGLKTTGDRYEDLATEYNEGNIHDMYQLDESSLVQGGSRGGKIYGCTHVFLSGYSSVFDIQAGGRVPVSYCSHTYLEISGKAVVRHVACGTITDGSTSTSSVQAVGGVDIFVTQQPTIATLLGAGYDTWSVNKGSTMKEGEIHINIYGGTFGYVYGGGMRGSVGDSTSQTTVDIYINMTGGTVLFDLFGGGRGGLDKIHHNAKVENNGDPDGSMGRWDKTQAKDSIGSKNSTGYSKVYGDINISIGGTAVINGNVYGGGESVPATKSYMNLQSGIFTFDNPVSGVASLTGDITISIDGATVRGSVYGTGKGIEIQSGAVKADLVNVSKVYNFDADGNPHDGSFEYSVFKTTGLVQIPYYSAIIIYNKTADTDGFRYIPWLYASSGATIDEGVGVITFNGTNYGDYAEVIGNVTVTINDSSIGGDVFGGGQMGHTDGTTSISITDSTVDGDVFGGGLGSKGKESVVGSRTITIDGATIKGNVYGGSRDGNDGKSNLNNSNAYIDIKEGSVKNVFGGGYEGITYGGTFITIGFDGPEEGGEGEWVNPKIVIRDSVYGGANVADPTKDPFKLVLVTNGSSILISGEYTDIAIKGTIMGDGNSCLTSGTKTLDLSFLDNRDQDDQGNIDLDKRGKMNGIHRFTQAKIISSVLDIVGREFDVGGVVKKYSITHIDSLILESSTTLMIEHAVDDVREYKSWNKDDMETTPTSPQNKIIFTTGATLLVRTIDDDTSLVTGYGRVYGYTVLSVGDNAPYGGYVMGSKLSEGGFVIIQNGSYELADRSDFEGMIRCWYISGVQNKTVTMTLEKDGSSLITDNASIQLNKMKTSSTVRYTGGTFVTYLDGYSFGPVPSGNTFTFQLGDNTISDNQYVLQNDYVDSLVVEAGATSSLARVISSGVATNYLQFKITANSEASDALYAEKCQEYESISGKTEVTITGSYFDKIVAYMLVTNDVNPYGLLLAGYKGTVMFDVSFRMSTNFSDRDVQSLVDAIQVAIGARTEADSIANSFVSGYTKGVFKTYEYSGVSSLVTYSSIQNSPTALSVYKKQSGDLVKILDNNYAGDCYLNLSFTGYPNGMTTYVGYLILYLQEVVPVDKDATGLKDDVMITNKIEIRVDLFIKGTTIEDEYDFTMNVVNGEGSVDFIIPEMLTDHSVNLLSVQPGEGITNDLTFTPVLNYGNNTGWASTKGSVSENSLNPGYVPPADPSGYEMEYIGKLSGSYMATLRISISDFQLEGGIFTVYVVVKDSGGAVKSTVRLNITLLERDKVTITFYDYKHGINENTGGVKLDYDYGSVINEAQCAPVMENFLAWYTDPDFTNTFNFSTPLITDMSLYARYTFVVTFDYRDGTTSELYVADESSGVFISKPKDPERIGYEFVAWYKDSRCIEPWDFNLDPVVGNTTLYAKWIGEEVFVIFQYRDSSQAIQTLDYSEVVDGKYTLPVVRYGNTFDVVDVTESALIGRNINILDVAQGKVQSLTVSKFIRWETHFNDHNILVGEDTVLNDTIFDISQTKDPTYDMKVITLSAVTSPNAVRINMNANTDDVSVVIEAPSSYLVYPEQDQSDPKVYTISYTLRNATRTGYYLHDWKDPATVEKTHLYPSPGLTRTLKFITEVDEVDHFTYIMEGYLKIGDEWSDEPVIEFDGHTDANVLDDPSREYVINYLADWVPIDYMISISNTAHGYIDAYKLEVDEHGNVNYVYGLSFTAHYGDRILLVFTPAEKYQFYRWTYMGECEIEDLYSSSTTLIVTGDSVVRVSDIGKRAVNLYLKLNGELNNTEISSLYLGHTADDGSYVYEEMTKATDPDTAIYTGYVFTGEYVVYVKDTEKGLYHEIGIAEVGVGDNIFSYEVYGIKLDITDGTQDISGTIAHTRYVGRSLYSSDPLVGSITIPAGHKYYAAAGEEHFAVGYLDKDEKFIQLLSLDENTTGVYTDTVLSFQLNIDQWSGERVIKGVIAPIPYEISFWIGDGLGANNLHWNVDGLDPNDFETQIGPTVQIFDDTISLATLSQFEEAGHQGLLEGYSIIHWYVNKNDSSGTFSTKVESGTELDAEFFKNISGGMSTRSFTLYAWVTKDATVDATVYLHKEHLGADDDVVQISSLLKSTIDGGYRIMFSVPSGFDLSGQRFDHTEVTSGTACSAADPVRDGNDIKIDVTTGGDSFILDVYYVLFTVDVKLHLDYDPGSITGWVKDEGASTAGNYVYKKSGVKYGSSVDLPQLSKGDRYVFDGYYDAKEGGSKIDSPMEVLSTSDINLYAHFSPKNTYTLSLITQVGYFVQNNQQRLELTYAEGEPIMEMFIPVSDDPHYHLIDPQNPYGAYPDSLDRDITLQANWGVDLQEFIVDVIELDVPEEDKKHIHISGTHDSSEIEFTNSEVKTNLPYNSEMIIVFKPDYNYDLDLSNFKLMKYDPGSGAADEDGYVVVDSVAGITVDDLEELDNGTYRLSFFLSENVKLKVKVKISTLDVNYYVNNALVYTQSVQKYAIVDLPTYGGPYVNVPGYTKSTEWFTVYDDPTSLYGKSTYQVIEEKSFYMKADPVNYYVWYHVPGESTTIEEVKTIITNYESETISVLPDYIQQFSYGSNGTLRPFTDKAAYDIEHQVRLGWSESATGELNYLLDHIVINLIDVNTDLTVLDNRIVEMHPYYLKIDDIENYGADKTSYGNYVYRGTGFGMGFQKTSASAVDNVEIWYSLIPLTRLNYDKYGTKSPLEFTDVNIDSGNVVAYIVHYYGWVKLVEGGVVIEEKSYLTPGIFTVTISKRDVTLESGSSSKAQDNEPLVDYRVNVWEGNVTAETPDKIAWTENWEDVDYLYSYYNIDTGETITGLPTNQGRYENRLEPDFSGSSLSATNYVLHYIYGTLTITAPASGIEIAETSYTMTYGGSLTLMASLASPYQSGYRLDYSSNDTDLLTVAADGEGHGVITLTNNKIGVAEVTISLVRISDSSVIETVPVQIVVTQKQISFTTTVSDTGKPYDGGYGLSDSQVVLYPTVEVLYESGQILEKDKDSIVIAVKTKEYSILTGKDVGTGKKIHVTYELTGASAGFYSIPQAEISGAHIDKCTVTMTAATASRAFNDTPLTDGTYTVNGVTPVVDEDGYTITGFAPEEGAKITVTGTVTYATEGPQPNVIAYELKGDTSPENYNIVLVDGTLTVNILKLDNIPDNISIGYTGLIVSGVSPSIYYERSAEERGGYSDRTPAVSAIEPGAYYVVLTLNFNNNGTNVTWNDETTGEKVIRWNIGAAELVNDFVLITEPVYYDGLSHTVQFSTSYDPEDYTITYLDVYDNPDDMIAAGEKKIIVTGAGRYTGGNFVFDYEIYKRPVILAGLDKVTVEDVVHYEQTLIYDGTNQNVTYTFKDPFSEIDREDPVAVSDGITVTITGDTHKVCGTYESILVSLSGSKASNYDFTDYAGCEVKWTIDQRIVYAVAKSAWKMYDGTPLAMNGYSVVGIVDGDEDYFQFTVAGVGSCTVQGIYVNDIDCTITDADVAACYEVHEINGSLIVSNSAYDISWISTEVVKK